MTRILFVCHGNICRSPMAEFIMKHMVRERGIEADFTIDSRATHTDEIGDDVHAGTARVLDEMGISHPKRAARLTSKSDYDKYDYICGMDNANIRNMMRIYGGDRLNKVSLLLDFAGGGEVADPWYTGNFEATRRDVIRGCEALLDRILSER